MLATLAEIIQRKERVLTVVDPARLERAQLLTPELSTRLHAKGSRVRMRYLAWLEQQLGLADPVDFAVPVPPHAEIVHETAQLIGLCFALARHSGVMLKAEYQALANRFGVKALNFALQHSALIADIPVVPRVAMTPEATIWPGAQWLAAWAESEQPGLETWIIAAFPEFQPVAPPDIESLARAAPVISAAVRTTWHKSQDQ